MRGADSDGYQPAAKERDGLVGGRRQALLARDPGAGRMLHWWRPVSAPNAALARRAPRTARLDVTRESERPRAWRQQGRRAVPGGDERAVGSQRGAHGPEVRVSAKQIREQCRDASKVVHGSVSRRRTQPDLWLLQWDSGQAFERVIGRIYNDSNRLQSRDT
jgi:hypothetical protein